MTDGAGSSAAEPIDIERIASRLAELGQTAIDDEHPYRAAVARKAFEDELERLLGFGVAMAWFKPDVDIEADNEFTLNFNDPAALAKTVDKLRPIGDLLKRGEYEVIDEIPAPQKPPAREVSHTQQPRIYQLPLWSEPDRGVPNSFLRSALFAAIQGKRPPTDEGRTPWLPAWHLREIYWRAARPVGSRRLGAGNPSRPTAPCW
jgi:hypothetical protein